MKIGIEPLSSGSVIIKGSIFMFRNIKCWKLRLSPNPVATLKLKMFKEIQKNFNSRDSILLVSLVY